MKIIILHFQQRCHYVQSSKYSQLYLRSAENHQTMTDLPKNSNLNRSQYQIQNCLILFHKFCLWTFLFHKIIK